MVLYSCPRCGYETYHKNCFKNHLNRKFICEPLYSNIPIIDIGKEYKINITPYKQKINMPLNNNNNKNNIRCEYCLKKLSRQDSLSRHLNICKKKKNNSILELKNSINTLITNNNTINNNTTNNNNLQIILNNYGNETKPELDDKYLMKLIKGAFSAVPKLVEKIHFDPEYPENSNVKITNKKLPYASIRKNNKWELEDKDKFINKLMEDKYNILEEYYIDLESKLDIKAKKLMACFKEKYETLDEELMKAIKKKTEIILLNNSK